MGYKRPLKFHMADKSLEPAKTGYRTICEVQRHIRKIVDCELADKEPDIAKRLVELIEETYDLGKRMDRKLREYSASYIHDMYEKI